MDWEELKENLTDVMKEFQAKIGYSKEVMRLYYPLESLNRLLGTELNEAGMQEALQSFSEETKPFFKGLSISHEGGRFCIAVPAEGVEYIHKTVPDPVFLKDFLQKIEAHPHGIEEILPAFEQYSDCVRCEKLDNGEFDYLVYFADGKPDPYRYCIKFEGCHAIYHRFTQKDYEAFGF